MRRGRSKFNVKSKRTDGFASDAERARFDYLYLLEKAGEIRDLKPHPPFQVEPEGCVPIRYTGDFQYMDVSGAASGKPGWTVEDVKPTPHYSQKKGKWEDPTDAAAKLRMKLFVGKFGEKYRLVLARKVGKQGWSVVEFGTRNSRAPKLPGGKVERCRSDPRTNHKPSKIDKR